MLHRRKRTGPLATRLIGHEPLITFVTFGELTKWTEIRDWGTRRREELADCAGPSAGRVLRGSAGPVHADCSARCSPPATDIYALRWDKARAGRAGWLPAVRGRWRKGVPHAERDYLPLTAEVLAAHLSGRHTSACTRCLVSLASGHVSPRQPFVIIVHDGCRRRVTCKQGDAIPAAHVWVPFAGESAFAAFPITAQPSQ